MTKKDYIKFAKLLKNSKPVKNYATHDKDYIDGAEACWLRMKDGIMDILAQDSYCFNPIKFEEFVK